MDLIIRSPLGVIFLGRPLLFRVPGDRIVNRRHATAKLLQKYVLCVFLQAMSLFAIFEWQKIFFFGGGGANIKLRDNTSETAKNY